MTKNDRDRQKPEASQFLTGWKEIASYMGKGVRTVQRYEWHLGLPVRRPAGKSRAAVLATKQEIDAWLSASPIRQSFELIRPASELPDATAKALQKNLAQMVELRLQMRELRAEMGMSIDLLRKSVNQLHGGLGSAQWWKTLAQARIDENHVDETRGGNGRSTGMPDRKRTKLN